jgi:lipid-A-disaccharide synthase
VASGTATLEAALAGVPMVVVYRVSRLSYFLVRPFFRLPWVCIVNILAGRALVPELLQGRVTPGRIAAAARPLLLEGTQRQEMIRGLEEVKRKLGSGRPSQRLSEILAGIIDPAPPAQTLRRQP